jgi:ectoine hydroxylase-related dioxygenase (phytanoyl-CoA dioxygenase family)
MSAEHLGRAIGALRTEGYVVLEDVVPHEPLDILQARMEEDSERLIRAQRWGGAGRLPGHLQQGPPPFAPYVFPEIVANPFVIQVTKELLGEGVYNSFYNGNTNCPGSQKQPLHGDGRHLWPDMETAHPTAAVVVNICPQGASEANGAVELWPGTHMVTGVGYPITEEQEEARRRVCPPVRGSMKKGSALIRDIRLWHRGVPNPGDRPRQMIAMIHNCRWLQRGKPLVYGKGCEEVLASNPDLDPNAVFTDEPIDYLFMVHRR